MSSPAAPSRWPVTAAWLLFAVAIAVFLSMRLQLSFDLGAFFPTKTGPQAEVLLHQLSSGPGSRMMVGGINGAALDDRLETGRRMVEALRDEAGFSVAFNGEANLDDVDIPEPLASAYPLMADIDWSQEGIRSALEQRLADMAMGGGSVFRSLVARDPYLATLDLLAHLSPGGDADEPWVADDGSAVITTQTDAPGTDLLAQTNAVQAMNDIFAAVKTHPDLELTITGVGAFSIKLQAIIQKEARLLGILAGSAITFVLLVVYRSLKLALLAAIPLALGFIAGVAAVALAFGTVHGITLAFGFTLLGVTVDYPLHLFSHARHQGGQAAIRSIWPTLRLGAASTATAYLAMVFAGSQGLAQLGVFTAVGLVVAVLVTRTLLPAFLGDGSGAVPDDEPPDEPSRRLLPALAGLVVAAALVFVLSGDQPWNDNMDTLSPVPRDLLASDQQLRSATASADIRYQVLVESSDLETLLVESERVDALLQGAVSEGHLSGWSSITALLPSRASQQDRMEDIPEQGAFEEILSRAVAETPFAQSAFAPFEDVVKSARLAFLMRPGAFDGTPLAAWRDVHLLNFSDKWVAVHTLQKPDPATLAPLVNTWGEAVRWIDLREASRDLMRDFRHDATLAVGLAALIIVVLLLIQRLSLGRLAWILITVAAALAVSICSVLLVHGYLTLVHLVALLLVLGLGLDYALFFSRPEPPAGRRATIQSILACSASTTLAFGILAMSTIPLLKFIGLTVATGSVANLLFAWLGSSRRLKLA